MIAYIKGILTEVEETSVVVETAGGVGYEIAVMASDFSLLPEVQEEVKFYTFFQVREDGMSLYGFLKKSELAVFKQLISVNGIGPKMGHGILSALGEQELRMSIVTGNVPALQRAPGVGKKTAERIILDLKDKVALDSVLFVEKPEKSSLRTKEEPEEIILMRENAIQILTALGIRQKDAVLCVQEIKFEEGMTEEDLVRLSLRQLS